MANVSTRIDDQIKARAEKVADDIGISLSTAINVFLKQFIANNGFPFDVVVPDKSGSRPIVDIVQLDAAVKEALSNPDNSGRPKKFTYLDPDTNELVTVIRKE